MIPPPPNSQPKREGFNKIISDIIHSVCPRGLQDLKSNLGLCVFRTRWNGSHPSNRVSREPNSLSWISTWEKECGLITLWHRGHILLLSRHTSLEPDSSLTMELFTNSFGNSHHIPGHHGHHSEAHAHWTSSKRCAFGHVVSSPQNLVGHWFP